MKLLYRITFRRLAFIVSLVSLSFSVIAQENEKLNVDFYGFVRVDAYMDTYKGQDLGHDIFYLLPHYAKVGEVEVNDQLSSNISAIASRLGVKINSDDVFNAKLTGVLEFDFAGNLRTDPTMFRIRQAFSMLSWEKSSLLMGQTWHPFFGAPHMPVVAGLNTGAPFHAFNRSPMIRYKYNLNSLSLTLAAVSEMQYATRAADYAVYMNTNNHAKRNGIVPELVLTADWSSKGKLFAGAGVEHKIIKPRMVIEKGEGVFARADEFLSSTGFVGYARYKGSKFSLLFKAYFGENMSHLVMPGGYGVATYAQATGRETYTNYKHYTAMMSAVYGKEFQLGLFAAYGQNLGTSEKLHAFNDGNVRTYGLFLPIQDMMRIAPHIAYNKGKLRFVAELESTIANYGQGSIKLDNGLYDNSVVATNNRLIFTMTHYF